MGGTGVGVGAGVSMRAFGREYEVLGEGLGGAWGRDDIRRGDIRSWVDNVVSSSYDRCSISALFSSWKLVLIFCHSVHSLRSSQVRHHEVPNNQRRYLDRFAYDSDDRSRRDQEAERASPSPSKVHRSRLTSSSPATDPTPPPLTPPTLPSPTTRSTPRPPPHKTQCQSWSGVMAHAPPTAPQLRTSLGKSPPTASWLSRPVRRGAAGRQPWTG